MLKKLRIQNYALIDDLEFTPSASLNIITGETGSGKSILLDGLGLILGDRADFKSLRNPEKKCIIEGLFDVSNDGLSDFFRKHDLDDDTECILRREILPSGKSRAFINDSPVALSTLKAIGLLLVDIHSQHAHMELDDQQFPLDILDAMLKPEMIQSYGNAYKKWTQLSKEIAELRQLIEKAEAEKDYKQFRFDELEAASLLEGEQAELENELSILEHAEAFRQLSERMQTQANEMDGSMIEHLGSWKKELESFGQQESVNKLVSRLGEMISELQDVLMEMGHLSDSMDADPAMLQEKNERLALLHELCRKYKCEDSDELIAIKSQLQKELETMVLSDEQLAALEQQEKEILKVVSRLASDIATARKSAAEAFVIKVSDMLKVLGMPFARLEFKFEPLVQAGPRGMDRVQLLFSANKGLPLSNIQEVASGGERSRFMLAVKSLMAENTALPTLIFDEIDTGVSGAISAAIADVLESMSVSHQLICITHSPQIASRGKNHFKIAKQHDLEKTYTQLVTLSGDERVKEIAGMLSGDSTGQSAMEHAKTLLAH